MTHLWLSHTAIYDKNALSLFSDVVVLRIACTDILYSNEKPLEDVGT